MVYIKKVILENFQSHKNTTLDLDKHLNVIVGPSDNGKSAIIRGIKWALYNEPSGDYFIREGEKDCSVTLIFNDGTKIKRYRSKSKNSYYLYDREGKETIFEGFGTTVPQEIIDKTGIKKILLDSDQSNSINIGEQLEGPFLLSEKTSTRASAIGRLVGVNIIDVALRDTLRDNRNLSINKKNIDEHINNLEEDLKQYEYLDDLIKKAKEIELLRNKVVEKNNKLDKLKSILNDLNDTKKEIDLIKEYLNKLIGIREVEILVKQLSTVIKKYIYIDSQHNRLNKIIKQKDESFEIIKALKNIDKANVNIEKLPLFNNKREKMIELQIKFSKGNGEISKYKNISNQLSQIENVELKVKDFQNKLNKLEKLNVIQEKLEKSKKSISIGKVYIDRLQNVDDIGLIYTNLKNKIDQYKKLDVIVNSYQSIGLEKSKENINIGKLNKTIKKSLEEYREILIKLEICPLCFSNIDNDTINHIISHYD
ncbi:AAA family ATPase [Tissierella sp. MSJ-40]|uniref:AAA family ATPase n=1 Tax=Tissierella simiarum TaxID=2841534 RepID=A0ABS6E418_9FIRM|nr:AAA family ATPase [Tissierella simiarum]MBU5437641.1 AAA family ATPase [Tissierella simiarum]